VRAASRNLAGFSDFTKVEKYKTLSLEPRVSSGVKETRNMCVELGVMTLMVLMRPFLG